MYQIDMTPDFNMDPRIPHGPSFRDITRMFLRRKGLFMLVCSIVFLCGGLYLLLARPLYLSSASMVLHFDSHVVPDIDRSRIPSQMSGSNEHREVLYSDADILRSPDLVREVIDKLGLSRLFPEIAAESGSDARKLDAAVKAFSNNLVVDVGLQSDVLNLSFLHPDATIARDTLQTLVDRFFAREAEVYSNPQLKFAEAEATGAKAKLSEAQNTLAAFKEKNQIADLQQQVQQFIGSRTDVESRLRIAEGRVKEAVDKQTALKQLLDDVPENVASSAPGEQYRTVDDIESRLEQLRAKRSEMSINYLPTSELLKPIDAQIAALTAAAKARNAEAKGRMSQLPNVVYQNIKTDYLRAVAEADSARQPRDVLSHQLDQINQRLATLESLHSQYDDLVRAVQIQNDTYRALAIRFETARFEANRNAQKISAAVVISAPMVPTTPARPRRKLVALATVAAALIAGVGCVLIVEAIDDRVRSARDVQRILRIPVLATFPRDA
jgi:uncharacterized protein involved in exopolysaccharide biosynthesis